MATFYEDDTPRILLIENQILDGVPHFPHVDTLRRRLLTASLDTPSRHVAPRALLKLATEGEPGVIFFTLFKKAHLGVRLRTRRNVLDIDEDMAPFYGNVLPGLDEMRGSAIDTAVEEFWLDFFRKDSPIHRVYVTAAMCLAAAIEEMR